MVGRKMPSAGSLLVGILVGLLVASVSNGSAASETDADMVWMTAAASRR